MRGCSGRDGRRAHRSTGSEYVLGGHERQKLDIYVPPAAGSDAADRVGAWRAWQAGSKDGCPRLVFWRRVRGGEHQLPAEPARDLSGADHRLQSGDTIPAGKRSEVPYRSGADRRLGASAGGHLVALLGTTGDVTKFDEGRTLSSQAVCRRCAISSGRRTLKIGTSVRRWITTRQIRRHRGSSAGQSRRMTRQYRTPTRLPTFRKTTRPFDCARDADPLVPHNQSELLQAAAGGGWREESAAHRQGRRAWVQ